MPCAAPDLPRTMFCRTFDQPYSAALVVSAVLPSISHPMLTDTLVKTAQDVLHDHPTLAMALVVAATMPILAMGIGLARWGIARLRPPTEAFADPPNAALRPRDARLILEGTDDPDGTLVVPAGAAPLRLGEAMLRMTARNDGDVTLRAAASDALLVNDPDRGILLTDLSPEGAARVRVNGETVASCQLLDGDTIELGVRRFRFVSTPLGAASTM